MPKRNVIHLTRVDAPNPQYTSVQDALLSNIDLLVRAIRLGEAGMRAAAVHQHQHPTALSAAVPEKAAANAR